MTHAAPAPAPAPQLLKIAEAARLSTLCRATLYNLMSRGELAYVKLGRTRRIPADALTDLIRRNTVPAAAAR